MGDGSSKRLANDLNCRDLSLDLVKVKTWLSYLTDVHPSYRGPAFQMPIYQAAWDKQHKARKDKANIAFVSGKVGKGIERHSQSDIAAGWESSGIARQAMPADSHVQSVMLANSSGYTDLSGLLLTAIQRKVVVSKDDDDEGDDGADEGQRLKATLSSEPACEFTNNHTILSLAFPYLFPLGVTADELGGANTVSKRVVQRLLCSYDDRFATSAQFLFLLANQKIRHAANHAVNFKLRERTDRVEEFVRLVNEPGFSDKLNNCVKNPQGAEATELLKKILPLINITGSKIPWSPLERKAATTHLYSMAQSSSAPFMFVTFSQKGIDDKLCLEFACSQGGMKEPITLTVDLEINRRGRILSANPVAAARAFECIVQAFMDHLVGMSSTAERRKTPLPTRGIFGRVSSAYGIHDVQGRVILHMHMLLFGTLDPNTIQRCFDDQELTKQFCRVLDSIVCGSLEGYEDLREGAQKKRDAKKQSIADRRKQSTVNRDLGNQLGDAAGGGKILLPLQRPEKDNSDGKLDGVAVGLRLAVDPAELVIDIKAGTTFVGEEARNVWTIKNINGGGQVLCAIVCFRWPR